MHKNARNTVLVSAVIIAAVAALLIFEPYVSMQVLRECFRATTVEMIPLPEECVQTNETPPADLMRIVEQQKRHYHLALQQMIVCRTRERLFQGELHNAFSEEVRRRWLPLYVGCCSYQFRRHIAVVASRVEQNGSIIVEAVLIQSRWDYLRLNWANDRRNWY